MHDFSTSNADEMYYSELADKVRFYKQDEVGVKDMCKIVEEYGDERAAAALKQGIEQGLQQGAQQQAIEDAIEFLKEKIPPEKVAKCIKLPIEKVLELQAQLPKEKN